VRNAQSGAESVERAGFYDAECTGWNGVERAQHSMRPQPGERMLVWQTIVRGNRVFA